jgi:hypothetical protein
MRLSKWFLRSRRAATLLKRPRAQELAAQNYNFIRRAAPARIDPAAPHQNIPKQTSARSALNSSRSGGRVGDARPTAVIVPAGSDPRLDSRGSGAAHFDLPLELEPEPVIFAAA